MSAMCHCGATWTGHRIEHCTACHETFTGTTAGDKHRTGQHHISTGPDRRRCLTAEEMRKKGMEQNARGQWTNGGTSPWAKEALPGAAHTPSGRLPVRTPGAALEEEREVIERWPA